MERCGVRFQTPLWGWTLQLYSRIAAACQLSSRRLSLADLEYSRMDLGTMLQGAGSSATARRRAIAGILPAGFTVANCLLRPCASRTPAPTLCHPFIFFNGILEMVFFIRLSMALLIRLIMALFTRPKIGLFHPTLTSVIMVSSFPPI